MQKYGTVIFPYLFISFLCAGTTFAFFHSGGNFPFSRHDLNIVSCKERHYKILPSEHLSYHDHGVYLGQIFW